MITWPRLGASKMPIYKKCWGGIRVLLGAKVLVNMRVFSKRFLGTKSVQEKSHWPPKFYFSQISDTFFTFHQDGS